MNRFFTLFFAASCLTAVGQVTYPYNPDGNADGDIAVGDLQDFLVTYGNPFSPSEIMVGDSSLTYWVEQLSQTIQEQQEMIDLLKGGDSRSLLYPDGLSGLLPIHHQFQQDGNFLIPPNKNLYITNYQGGSGDLFADNYLLISAPSSSPVKFSSPIKLASGTLITSTSFSTNDDSFVGFLVDRRVEPVTINIREESFTVPTGKYFVLNYFAVSEVGNSKLYVNGSETSTDANGGFGYWTHPSALTFGAGDILSPQQYVDNSQFNLFGYLVDIEMLVLETPTTGDDDLHIYCNNAAVNANAAGAGNTDTSVDITACTKGKSNSQAVDGSAVGQTNDHFYIVSDGSAVGTYDAGKLLIRTTGFALDEAAADTFV